MPHSKVKNDFIKMNEYRFILDTKSKKFVCPECSKRTFTRYIDSATGEYLQDHYGRCDREQKCNYHLNPYKDGFSKKIWEQENGSGANFQKKQLIPYKPKPKQEIKKPGFIPYEILKATRKGYDQNIFIQNLLHRVQFPFDAKEIEQVIKLYHLGTICKGYRTGAITFPFIDTKGNVRAIQAKQFDEINHTISTDFLHSIYKRDCENKNQSLPEWLKCYLENETKVSCLFGEHLLTKYQTNPIALVEAPKTAIMGTLYFGFPNNPKNFLWLAVYNLSSLNIEKIKVLQGRKVVLFPDLNAFDNWSNKASEFEKQMPGTLFKVSDLLERKATNEEKENGLDLADYLLRFDRKDFQKADKEIEPVNILIDNIISIPWETITGKEFERMKIVWIKTKDASFDVLFNNEGEPVNQITNTVMRLSEFFEKDFKPSLIDGQKCLAHINN